MGLDDFPHPLVMALRQLRLIQQMVAHSGELAVLALFPSAVIAPVVMLRAQRHGFGVFLGLHTVIAQYHHAGNTMLPRGFQIAVKPLHEAVVLLIPYKKFQNDADGIKAGFRRQRQFLIGGFQPFLEAFLLPLVDAVGAIAAHEVAAAQPVMIVVPFPSPFLAPYFAHLCHSYSLSSPVWLICLFTPTLFRKDYKRIFPAASIETAYPVNI